MSSSSSASSSEVASSVAVEGLLEGSRIGTQGPYGFVMFKGIHDGFQRGIFRKVLLINGGSFKLWWHSCKDSCLNHGVVYCLLGTRQLVSDVEKAGKELGNGCAWLWSHLLE